MTGRLHQQHSQPSRRKIASCRAFGKFFRCDSSGMVQSVNETAVCMARLVNYIIAEIRPAILAKPPCYFYGSANTQTAPPSGTSGNSPGK